MPPWGEFQTTVTVICARPAEGVFGVTVTLRLKVVWSSGSFVACSGLAGSSIVARDLQDRRAQRQRLEVVHLLARQEHRLLQVLAARRDLDRGELRDGDREQADAQDRHRDQHLDQREAGLATRVTVSSVKLHD